MVELRVDGRITAASALGFTGPLRSCLAAGRPFLALFDRRTISAPTPDGRAALEELYRDWPAVAGLVLAWADVYDERRARSLERARRAREAAGTQVGPAYPYRLFDDLGAARDWLAGVGPALVAPGR